MHILGKTKKLCPGNRADLGLSNSEIERHLPISNHSVTDLRKLWGNREWYVKPFAADHRPCGKFERPIEANVVLW